MKSKVKLSKFDNSNFSKEASFIKIGIWYFINILFIRNSLFPFSKFKIILLRLFGAKMGKNILLKPSVNIKFPWKLKVGNNTWIGEHVWIDNLDNVEIGNNVCLSQGCLLLTGNHDYKNPTFPYRNRPIIIHDGVWIGAKSIVCSGVTVNSDAILTVGSIATKNIESSAIYQGNPAKKIRERKIHS